MPINALRQGQQHKTSSREHGPPTRRFRFHVFLTPWIMLQAADVFPPVLWVRQPKRLQADNAPQTNSANTFKVSLHLSNLLKRTTSHRRQLVKHSSQLLRATEREIAPTAPSKITPAPARVSTERQTSAIAHEALPENYRWREVPPTPPSSLKAYTQQL